ncbi:unnamed protein product [Phytophthora lilii]|uniref:Unnamed protein product n=1 Tax=Phytophthora lilii TaxID=2077276 RepID=A0A9W6U7X0_9STRA|nr:unnamed protein product [Phytophthora lilii]
MWKSVAAIARRECKAAQAENGRLKNELHMYAQASEKLQAQLIHANARQQHWMDGTFAFVNAIRVGMIMSRHLQLENTRIFDSLESKVNERFHEVDTIVREAVRPLQQGATEHVQICRGHDLDAAAAVEFKHARLLPFERDSTASTLWEIIALGGLLTDHEVHVASRSSDTVRMASRFTVPLDRAHSSLVSVDVHAVAKRFPSAIGMVVMMESRSEWSIHYSSAPTWKQTTEETGWVVVNEYPLQVYGDSQRACQLRTAMKLRPNTSDGDGSNTCSGITGCVGDIVIPSFREILSSHHQSVENFLLNSSKTTT